MDNIPSPLSPQPMPQPPTAPTMDVRQGSTPQPQFSQPAQTPQTDAPQMFVQPDIVQQDIDDVYEKITLYEKIRETLGDPNLAATLDAEKKALLVSSASELSAQLDELGFTMPAINMVQPAAGPALQRTDTPPPAAELKIER